MVKFYLAPEVRNRNFYLAPGMRNGKIYLAPNDSYEKFYLAVSGLMERLPFIAFRRMLASTLAFLVVKWQSELKSFDNAKLKQLLILLYFDTIPYCII